MIYFFFISFQNFHLIKYVSILSFFLKFKDNILNLYFEDLNVFITNMNIR